MSVRERLLEAIAKGEEAQRQKIEKVANYIIDRIIEKASTKGGCTKVRVYPNDVLHDNNRGFTDFTMENYREIGACVEKMSEGLVKCEIGSENGRDTFITSEIVKTDSK